ncbi:hypothetical protein GCM10023185_42800 [Hymenobacter saemangeumensis]|uniref:Uncharacterized protein n=1 Tax=Hymenobacter saemangeumensis TaxID=1084522 RepID=A0ABP8IS77_9BACT
MPLLWPINEMDSKHYGFNSEVLTSNAYACAVIHVGDAQAGRKAVSTPVYVSVSRCMARVQAT